jgi:Cu-Zn family superoxide dismutase
MMKTTVRTVLTALVAALSLCACSSMHDRMADKHKGMHDMGPSAHVMMEPTQGNSAKGMVMFMQHGDHVMVHAKLSGLKPGQTHGFHVHDKGDCSSPDGTSAGGHYNPNGQPHGPQDAAHHAGDMPALKADAEGKVDAMFHLQGVTLGQGEGPSLLGRGVIVHAGPDDYQTQPTGNSGARIACGVITAKQGAAGGGHQH